MWKRRIVLQVVRKSSDGSTQEVVEKIFSEHRIDFVYHSLMGGRAADTCEIKLYNIGYENLRFLADSTRSKTESLEVRLQVGYMDEHPTDESMPTIVAGEIMGVFGQRVLPDHVTTLYCVPQEGRVYNSNPTVLNVGEGKTLREAIISYCTAIGFKETIFQVNEREEPVLDKVIPNFSADGTMMEVLTALTNQHHLLYTLISGGVVITSVADEQELIRQATIAEQRIEAGTERTIEVVGVAKPVHILNSNLLRGTPSIEVSKFTAVVALNTEMLPLHVIDVSRINGVDVSNGEFPLVGIGSNNSGAGVYRDKQFAHYTTGSTYQIKELMHVGSNYTSTWETTISAFTFRDNLSDNNSIPIPFTVNVS